MKTLPILSDQEVVRIVPEPDPDSGFGSLATEKGHLPLHAMDVRADIDGLVSHVTLTQTFVNTLGEPLEATYIFPLPDRAAVTSFRMEVAGRVVEGILKERGEARREYDEAIQAGQRAAITEEDRAGVFTLRVGNLMPGETAKVRLAMAGPLPFSDGEATFRFPLVVAPRYIPGTPLPGLSVGDGTALDTDAVPDASRITAPVLLPGYPNPVQLSLSVNVRAGALPLRDFRSSLHAVVEEEQAGLRRIRLQPDERLNRDFILRFQVAEKALATSLTVRPDAEGDAGTFLLTLVPPQGTTDGQHPKDRDIVFVLDRSGSMSGWKMVAARRALARMVDTLTDRDRFLIYAFDDAIESPAGLEGGLVVATDRNRFRAVEFLAKIQARGGTEMAQPLARAVQVLASVGSQPSGPRDRILVLVTDGQVGNEDQILRKLGGQVAGLRIFTLGIDQAVNAAFLRRLAALGGGFCELVESEDRLDQVMDSLHRRIATPVLTRLKLEPSGLGFETGSLVPSRLPDLFAGTPLFLFGCYQGEAKGGLTMQASDGLGRPWTQTIAAKKTDNAALTVLWARGQVRELEDRYACGQGDATGLSKQIVATSVKYGVLCRFTAFVAVDRSESVNSGGQQHCIIQPVEMPARWEMGTVDCLAQSPIRAARPRVGGYKSKKVESVDCLMQLKSVPAHATTDLAPYRRRTAELLEQLRSKTTANDAERLTALAYLAMKLTELVTDLKSIGADPSEVQPLKTLLTDLQQSLGKPQASVELVRLWTEAEAVLRAFVGEQLKPAAAKRRENFWK
jgi:Ca-activated chloride channel family protein